MHDANPRRIVSWLVALAIVPVAAYSTADGAAAEAGPEAYRKLVAAEPELAAWWPFDGDLNDAKGTAHGQPKGGQAQFAEGPAGGKALVLDQGRFVTMGATPELDFPETTVELWFKPDFAPNPGYNPCLIAKRADGDHANTRFSVHVMGDYSRLAVWNGRAVMLYTVGSGPLQRGQWHHLAVTCTPQAMRMFEGPGEGFNFAKKAMPLSIGSSQPRGAEWMACSVDEVAIYRKALSEETLAAHVDAMGWRDRREQLAKARQARLDQERKLRLEQDARREKRRAELLADPALFDRGQPTIYTGQRLGAISFTLGGIGAGSIQINGKAERAVWQIFNNHRHAAVPNSFFAVRAEVAGGPSAVRALQTSPVGPFPAMKELTFRGEYPFAWYTFADPGSPIKVSLEAFNPLVPLCARDSAIPCAIFNLTAENPTDRPVGVTFLAAQQNAVGFLGDKPIQGRSYPGYGGNKNAVLREGKATVLSMTCDKPKTAPGQGDMALAAVAEDVSANAAWTNLDELAKDFGDGALQGPLAAGPSPPGQTLDGALAVTFTLAPGQKRAAAFVLAWHFPNVRHGIDAWHAAGNWYDNHWQSAQAVAADVVARLDDLTAKTRLFHDALYESNLPYWLLDRISSQLAVLRSQTCYWGKDGYFGGWEGCGTGNGCCHGNCNHVWHYAQAHGRLFPEIARQMRAQEFKYQARDGAIPHRQFASHPAFDGQCGAVLNSYREHLMSPDRTWLDANWPRIRRAMDYTIATWDKDGDGVLAGPQWNTLDGALGGSTSWLGTLYLAALAAAEKMALLENDPDTAKRYAAIRRSGATKQDETLFNGEYYIQIPDPEPREDYVTGCAIDQLLGQWWAHQLDLGWLYPPEHARTALGSLFKYNFRGTMQGLKQAPRKFVADDDPAMQMITWPKGPRPAKVILYGDEAMTGFEYAAAAAMIQAGLVREGFATARAVWIRYDGRLRTGLTPGDTSSWGYSGNPFGDDECGKFYARAMSVWSLLLATQGFVYDGPAQKIGFRPVWKPDDHASFFTAAEGWGVFRQRRTANAQTASLDLRYGRLPVRTLVLALPAGTQPAALEVEVDGKAVPARCT
ncbi:MAG: GH116 family glycosyl-hydrolase, partial [Thermoguttaceae bacterium]|nr:GH116 family glycosyl-hydrolase [Thermoguttaceae bacterium]